MARVAAGFVVLTIAAPAGAQVSRSLLVGGWAEPGFCDSGRGMIFYRSGRFFPGEGFPMTRYRLDGNTVHFSDGGRVVIEALDANRLVIRRPRARPVVLEGCPNASTD